MYVFNFPQKRLIESLAIPILCIVLTAVVCVAFNSKLLKRSHFLEGLHVADLKKITHLKQEVTSLDAYKQQKNEEKTKVIIYKSEDAVYSHTIELDRETNELAVQTIDNQTEQPVDETVQLAFQQVVSLIPIDTNNLPIQIVLAENSRRYYALTRISYGSMSLVYALGADQYGSNVQLQTLYSDLENSKMSVLCGYKIYIYYPKLQKYVRSFGCADGGGGGGTLQLVDSLGNSAEIQAYGTGANTLADFSENPLPLFLGNTDGLLYFGEMVGVETPMDGLASGEWTQKIYSIDPLSNKKVYLDINLTKGRYDSAYDANDRKLHEIALQSMSGENNAIPKFSYLNVKTLQIR